MSSIENRRALAEATHELVKTNRPDGQIYKRVLDALSAVASDDVGRPVKAVLAVTRAELDRANEETSNG